MDKAKQRQDLEGPTLMPQGGAAPTAAMILLHGLGADGQDLISLGEMWQKAFPTMAFFAPNAPEKCDLAPVGLQWFSLKDQDPNRILRDVQAAAPTVESFVDAVMAQTGLKENQIVLGGFSQGGMMALHVGLHHKSNVAGILSFSGALVEAPEGDAKGPFPPVQLVHGTVDPVVPHEASRRACEHLKKLGVDASFLSCPDVPHGIDGQGLEAGRKFLEKVLGH